MPNIEDIHPKLAVKHADVQLIRDVMAGARTIKRKRTEYLPFSRTAQPVEEYDRLLQYTSFFPATSRTAQAKRGLMTAKNVVLNAPVLEPIKDVITRNADSVRDLAEEVIWETFQTNFTGLLADHPEAPDGVSLNAANALRLNYRPFIHLFPLESILWIDYGIKGPLRTFERVVLREREDRILELVMVNGIYVQRVWEKKDGLGFEITEVREPRKDGQRLTSIPFTVVSDNTKSWPQDSELKDLAELNLDHYKVSARIANIQMFASGVVPVFSGIKLQKDDDGQDIPPNLYIGAGGVVVLEEPTAKWGFLEPEGHTMDGLMKTRDDFQEQMAKVGGNLIASERNKAPESDTQSARRGAGEDSAVASLALVYARRISDALSWCSWWMDGSKAVFTLNTDYKMGGMTAQERTVALAELQAGVTSWDTWFLERRDKGVVNASLLPDEERARIDQDNIDRPTAEI
ncbi:hypothetical protein ASF00_09310 [Sphingomonas sp. Leaf34]|uniref:DUF4055 domain-containing protein n=1 Tax=Sphingomonas sp. Leaf34 TaxID=1736216 RepID=UPI0006F84FD1|nr:DUF4055 domain-containing protein [Sphingomonas sp. Leaf34]KQN28096.1 hypothetical protein ASF00_09310 [Sphingomonas sp. Leaf34]